MDLETFQRLSEQLAGGRLTHVEFLEVIRQFGDAFPDDANNREEKAKILAVLDRLIENIKSNEEFEKEDLARQIQTWLDGPQDGSDPTGSEDT